MGGRGHFRAVLYYLVPKHKKPTLRSLRGRLQPHPSKFDDSHHVVWKISLNAIDLRQAHTHTRAQAAGESPGRQSLE